MSKNLITRVPQNKSDPRKTQQRRRSQKKRNLRSCPSINVSVTAASQKFVTKHRASVVSFAAVFRLVTQRSYPTKETAYVGDTTLFISFKHRISGPSVSVESRRTASAAVRSGDLMMADFNFFLLQIAYQIKSNDLADMKFLCEGDDALPTGKLERIETPRELLNFLRKSGKISPGEVMYLVNLLQTVGLVQLAKRVKEMGKKSILIFSSATTFVA